MILTEEVFDLQNATVADIALAFPQAIEVLNRHQLDFCCNGKMKFTDACQKARLDSKKVWSEIQATKGASDTGLKFETWDTGLLIDFIIQNHHSYVRQAIPRIQELLDKVCTVHGMEQPNLYKVRADFTKLSEELIQHLPKEEEVVFPALRNMAEGEKSPFYDHINALISVMEHEHDSAGNLVKSIRQLTNQYTPPSFACPTFQLTYKLLQEFDNDLIQHIHLENNVLFPKAKITIV